MVDVHMDPIDPDAQLMLAVQHGDGTAFEHLIDKYHRPIVNFIYRIVNNAAEAEELAQEVFLRIYRARERYEPRARFSSWIYRIAANLSIKEAARKRRAQFWGRDSRSEDDARDAADSYSDPSPNAEGRLISAELARVLQRAIRSLPPRERTALVLRRYEEMSYREIAEVMGCTEAAVKTYIHRGKLHVRASILPYLEKGRI